MFGIGYSIKHIFPETKPASGFLPIFRSAVFAILPPMDIATPGTGPDQTLSGNAASARGEKACSAAAGDRPPSALRRLLPVLVIAVVTLATFAGALRNGFLLDDVPCVVENPAFRDIRDIPTIFRSDDAIGTPEHNPYYRPLTTLTFALDRFLHGPAPRGYHATNIILHLVVSILVYLAAARISASRRSAFFAALLFAIHPAHAEPVAYISARADLLCGLGMAAALLAHLRWRETASGRDLAISVACYAVASFSKSIAVVFPALLAIHALSLEPGKRRWLAAVLPYAAVAMLFLAVREYVLVVKSWEGSYPLGIRLSNTGLFLVKYLRNALFPFGLRLFYDIPVRPSLLEPSVLSAWSIIAAIAFFAAATVRRHTAAVFGTAWFFACLLPVCGLIGIFYPSPMADRYMYVPLIGLALASASLFDRIPAGAFRAGARSPLGGVLLILAAGMASTTAIRIADWRGPLTYWQSAEGDTPGSAHILIGLGAAYADAGMLPPARQTLARAVAILDDRADIRLLMAEIAVRQGDVAAAERYLRRALELEPGNPGALSLLEIVSARTGGPREARAPGRAVPGEAAPSPARPSGGG